ncbi:MAG: formate dehydrogenase subunit gamma [Deltaproteobacteria bacterium]|nr:formate dehydrogenase subunit gamma [Deltaproteobacteria bacterium]
MALKFQKRSGRSAARKGLWTLAVLSASVLVSNVGYLLAQSALKNPNDLLRDAIGGKDYLFNVDMFLLLRNSPLIPSFGIAMVVFAILMLGHYFTFGPKDMSGGGDADLIPWFTLTERILHGVVVVSFLMLITSGLFITFGKNLGGGTGTLVLRTLHEYAGFVYGPAFIIIVVMWFKEALFHSYDMVWFAKFGGYLGYKGSIVSGKFNAGQKLYFWIMSVTGALHIWTGYSLIFELGAMSDRRFYVVVHFLSTIPMALMFLVHLYMTTLGTKGSFMSMINGQFSRKAAQQYHPESSSLKASPAKGR